MNQQQPKPARGEIRRERVLEAALTIFAKRGYQASLAEIARAAGITRTVLYYYFESKQDLFEAVFQQQVSELVNEVAPVIVAPGSQEERMRQVLKKMLQFSMDNPDSWGFLFQQTDETDPDVVEVRTRAGQGLRDAAKSLFTADLQRSGLAHDSNKVSILFEMMLGGFASVVGWWHANPTVPIEELEEALAVVQRALLRSFHPDAEETYQPDDAVSMG